MASTKHKLQAHLLVSVFYLLLIMPMQATGDCECKSESQNDDGKSKAALDLKLAAIASILVASVIGVCLPILGKSIPALQPEKDMFFVIKSFAAGVILATGMIHVLPDAFENLTSECLKEPWNKFPFAGFIAMLSAIATLMIDAFATAYYKRQMGNAGEMDVERNAVHTHATHGHAHGNVSASHGWKSVDLVRQRVVSQVLELGIIVHSVIIGISMGTSEKPRTIRPLVAAFCFHQLFEGMGLGGCIAQAKFQARSIVIMVLFFALTTPVGIALGIAISSVYKEDSPTALIVEGVFNAASSGILVYMALVDLLAVDFMDPRIQSNGKLQLWVNASLLLGAGCMSVMAKWA